MNTSPTFHHQLHHLLGSAASSKRHSSQLCSYTHPSFPARLMHFPSYAAPVPASYEMVPPGKILFQNTDLKCPRIISWLPLTVFADLLPTVAAKPWVVTE